MIRVCTVDGMPFLRAANLLCLRNVHLVHHLLLLDEHLLERVEVGLQVLQLHVIGRRGRDSGGHLNKISKLPYSSHLR